MTEDRVADARVRLMAALTESTAVLRSLEEQQRLVLEASRESNADDEHDPEGATIAFEREQASALIAQARRHRDEVVAALARLDRGSYGVCEGCGRPVGAARLDARPSARTCITCARS